MQDINNMSDTDINPSPPQDTTLTVNYPRTLVSDNNSNDLLQRADKTTRVAVSLNISLMNRVPHIMYTITS